MKNLELMNEKNNTNDIFKLNKMINSKSGDIVKQIKTGKKKELFMLLFLYFSEFKKEIINAIKRTYKISFYYSIWYIETKHNLNYTVPTLPAIKIRKTAGLSVIERIQHQQYNLYNRLLNAYNTDDKTIKEAVDGLLGFGGVTGLSYILNRIIRTECNRIQNIACVDAFKTLGIKAFVYHAEFDNRTCDKCYELNGKVFNLDDDDIYDKLPPLHPNCRCYIEPVLEYKKKNRSRIERLEFKKYLLENKIDI